MADPIPQLPPYPAAATPGDYVWVDWWKKLQQYMQAIANNATQALSPTHNLTLVNSWTNVGTTYGNAGYYTDPYGNVFLIGQIHGGIIPSVCATLPAGFRPVTDMEFPCASGASVGRISITGTTSSLPGQITVLNGASGGTISLNGIYFRTTLG